MHSSSQPSYKQPIEISKFGIVWDYSMTIDNSIVNQTSKHNVNAVGPIYEEALQEEILKWECFRAINFNPGCPDLPYQGPQAPSWSQLIKDPMPLQPT